MSIHWSGYSGHCRVGIDYTISPASPSHTTTSVTVTWKFYVGTDGWGFDDNQSVAVTATNWSGTSYSFHNSGQSSLYLGSHSETYGISYSTGTAEATANLNGAYNGANPSIALHITLPARPVATPSSGEAPTASNITTTSALISWGAPSDNGGASVDEYQLQVDNSSGFGSPEYDVTFDETGAASHTATGLSANTHYYARVRAHNSAGWGDWTAATTCEFTTDGGPPATPAGLAFTSVSKTSISVSWNSVGQNGGGTVSYHCQLGTDAAFTTGVQDYNGTSTHTTFSGISVATTYFVHVSAYNSFGYSSFSSTISVTTPPSGVYNDSGDFRTLVNNFSSAVADKLVHLGIYAQATYTAAVNMTANTVHLLNMNTITSSRGPDQPSGVTGTDSFKINYPGTYQIEWTFNVVQADTWTGVIEVNGARDITTTTQKGGIESGVTISHVYPDSVYTVSITRHLDVGDTLAFGVVCTTACTITGNAQGIVAQARATMVGF